MQASERPALGQKLQGFTQRVSLPGTETSNLQGTQQHKRILSDRTKQDLRIEPDAGVALEKQKTQAASRKFTGFGMTPSGE